MTRSFFPLLLGLAVPASAQIFEIGAHGGASRLSGKQIGFLTDNTGRSIPVELKDGWRFGFRMTVNNLRFFGHEGLYAYNRTQLSIGGQEQGMAIHQGFYNFLLYGTPEGTVVRPFATGGVHFSNFVPPGASATSGGGSNKFGINYGGGVKVRVAPNWGIRLDLRQYLTGKPFDLPGASGKLRQLEISAGFMFMM